MNRALLVGINDYPDAPLNGCVNDVQDMANMLVDRAGFAHADVRLITDRRATTQAILERLAWLVHGARSGDRILFHFSGHGAQLPTRNPAGEVDKLDEVICPVDYDWTDEHAIRDKMLARIFSPVPEGVEFVWISDSCHSGDLTREIERKPRTMRAPVDIAWRLQTATKAQRKPLSFVRAVNGLNVALIAACKSNQTASDAVFKGTPNGALTWALLKELNEPGGREQSLTTLVIGTRRRLKEANFHQEPQLEGSVAIMNKGFLA